MSRSIFNYSERRNVLFHFLHSATIPDWVYPISEIENCKIAMVAELLREIEHAMSTKASTNGEGNRATRDNNDDKDYYTDLSFSQLDARLIISMNSLLKFSPPFLPEAPSQLHQITPMSSSTVWDDRLELFAHFLLWSSIVTPVAKWEKSDGVSLTRRLPFTDADISKFEWDPWLIFMPRRNREIDWDRLNLIFLLL